MEAQERIKEKRCEGCGWIVHERWPKGMDAARCMHPEGLRGPGRVIGNPWSRELGPPALIRPAWCPEAGEERREK